jgi:hypothetical protein
VYLRQEVVQSVEKVFCRLFRNFLILSHILTLKTASGRTQIPNRAYTIWFFWEKTQKSIVGRGYGVTPPNLVLGFFWQVLFWHRVIYFYYVKCRTHLFFVSKNRWGQADIKKIDFPFLFSIKSFLKKKLFLKKPFFLKGRKTFNRKCYQICFFLNS